MLKRLLLISTLSAFVIAPDARAKNVKGVLVPVIGQDDTLSTNSDVAQKGDVIFSQNLIAEKTAKLSKAFYLQRDNSFDSRYDLKTDDLLYRVVFPKYDMAYCSLKHGFSQKPKIGKIWDSQICLIDTDKDGKFDLEFAGATRKFDLSPLSLNILWSDDLDFEPLPFTEFGPQPEANVSVRVELSKLSAKKAKFKVMVQLTEGEWEEYGESSIKFDKETQFPVIADVYGAEIKIEAIDKKTMTFEVLKGFSKTEPIMLE